MLNDVLSHLIAIAVGAIVAALWTSRLYPAILQGFLEPTKLAPEYRGVLDFGRGPRHEISLQIRKRGYTIRGKLVFIKGRHQGKEYPVKGRYWHSLMTFHYFPADKASTSQGTATFQRRHDGGSFSGYFAYYSQESDTVATVKCELTPH